MEERYRGFLKEVSSFIPKARIYTDCLRRLAWGTDAGFYRMTPQIVIRSDGEQEVSRILSLAQKEGIPVTFRAAGTSLSGQAISDSVLVVAGKNWEKYSISPDGSEVTLEPGIIGGKVNALLKPYGRKFGPDPASINSCMVGGIVMNNASGMSCGTHANSDKEMESARIVFADGTILGTGDEESRKAFSQSHADFIAEIQHLRDEILADKQLTERIRYKYSIKNVTGLNLLPFVKFTDPFDIIAHLLVGSEGILAFLSRITMKTVPIPGAEASAMVYFPDIASAAKAVVSLKDKIDPSTLNAVELLDRRSLASVDDSVLAIHQGEDITALLIRVSGKDEKELEENISATTAVLKEFKTIGEVRFTSDPAETGRYWAMRSGIFPSVGGMRKKGTTCLIEDVAFHIEDLPKATEDLSELLTRHGYDDSCIYGHALEGNFHFIINQSFSSQQEIDRYESLIRDVVDMVVTKYDGSLKAEHGTGRNMAPFVEKEWGPVAFGYMKRVKKLFDPKGILNPGVIFNDDPKCFIKGFKELPILSPWDEDGHSKEDALEKAYEKINKCIECGFCEVNCLSCGFTLSSRTRIVSQREITRLRRLPSPTESEKELLKKLVKEYSYYGEKTCAADGLCSMSCPMGINVADLTHQVRRKELPEGSASYKLWEQVARHYSGVKSGLKLLLGTATAGDAVLGDKAMGAICKGLHDSVKIPLWTPSTPKPYSIPKKLLDEQAFLRTPGGAGMESPSKVVYFPSCINQMMGLPLHRHVVDKPLVEEMVSLLHKGGYEVIFPKNMSGMCCGTIWESKGMPEVADRKTRELEDALWEASAHGKYPVLCDQSPCLLRLREKITRMKLYEPVEFIMTFLKDSLVFHQSDTPVTIHMTCSMRKMGLTGMMTELAGLCSSKVIVPEGVGCCGYAGDRGMNFPELNRYALRKLRQEVKGVPVGYSNSRTCEIGLATNSGIPYVSIAYLVDSCTEPVRK